MNPINSELAGIIILASGCVIGWTLAQCVIMATQLWRWRQARRGKSKGANRVRN